MYFYTTMEFQLLLLQKQKARSKYSVNMDMLLHNQLATETITSSQQQKLSSVASLHSYLWHTPTVTGTCAMRSAGVAKMKSGGGGQDGGPKLFMLSSILNKENSWPTPSFVANVLSVIKRCSSKATLGTHPISNLNDKNGN